MEKVKIGVLGVARGGTMIQYCEDSQNAKVVAICDKWEEGLNRKKAELNDPDITYYTSFDEFLKHDMDAVVLANYANEHTPFAIRCLQAGKHVFSEVLPVQSLSEAVQLTEAVEKSDKIYAYSENYCYMSTPREMKKLYRAGKLGTFEYGEGEYLHNCESIWPSITQGDPQHWRNHMYANFYCTHSIGPVVHITGLRPVSVTGFETPYNERMARCGAKAGAIGLEIITFENGAVLKSLHGVGCSKNSIWYSLYGTKGSMESERELAEESSCSKIHLDLDEFEGENGKHPAHYAIAEEDAVGNLANSHGGSDFYSMYNFVEKIRGNEADIIDVYEALDMFLPGLLAYRSVLNGGAPQSIPDFRDPAQREKYRQDTACTDPRVAKEQLIPSYSKGDPEVPDFVYEDIRRKWEDSLKK